jgi:hypothetical protein
MGSGRRFPVATSIADEASLPVSMSVRPSEENWRARIFWTCDSIRQIRSPVAAFQRSISERPGLAAGCDAEARNRPSGDHAIVETGSTRSNAADPNRAMILSEVFEFSATGGFGGWAKFGSGVAPQKIPRKRSAHGLRLMRTSSSWSMGLRNSLYTNLTHLRRHCISQLDEPRAGIICLPSGEPDSLIIPHLPMVKMKDRPSSRGVSEQSGIRGPAQRQLHSMHSAIPKH